MKKIVIALTMALFIFSAGISLAVENVVPSHAYYLAASNPNVYILDVRTAAEWEWVGHPGQNKLGEGSELAGKVVHIPYQIDHQGTRIVNPSFLTDVREIFDGNPEVVLILMCRSGQRSLAGANLLEEAGFQAMNMLTGFEGGTDSLGYRNTGKGWKNELLPYTFGRSAIYMD
jgi:rhodanese-related sulfurtransferase